MTRRLPRLALLLLSLLLPAAPALADALEREMIAALRGALPGVKVYPMGEGLLAIETAEQTLAMNLQGLRDICGSQPDRCENSKERFLRQAVAAATGVQEQQVTRSNVYPALRSDQALPAASGYISQPFVPGISLVYLIDMPDGFGYMREVDRQRLDVDLAGLHRLALANAARLGPIAMERPEELPGILVAYAEDDMGTPRLFDPGFLAALERQAGGAVVLATPTRNWLLAAPAGDRAAVSLLAELAAYLFETEHHPISPQLFERRGARWAAVAP